MLELLRCKLLDVQRTKINVDRTQLDKVYNLSIKLEEIDDIQNIYMNVTLGQ